ncbi:MAG: sortase, partial [Terriglobia bacterium]
MAQQLEERNIAFSIVFLALFTVTFVFLDIVGATPDFTARWNDEHGGTPVANSASSPASASSSGELPLKIVIDSINLTATVGNPTSSDNDTMDQFLKSGAVRYPSSALLGESGTVLLFGHSSYLPIVANHAYKTFDGIQNLKNGDEISVYSSDREYRYQVTGVSRVEASTGSVALPSDGEYLT